jgi:lactate dehydrogenase-like 2-hydroxyacid dehydrogenase
MRGRFAGAIVLAIGAGAIEAEVARRHAAARMPVEGSNSSRVFDLTAFDFALRK